MKHIGGLNQFSAAANLTLSQHFLEKKKKSDVKEKILSTKSILPVKFITGLWQGALVIKNKW